MTRVTSSSHSLPGVVAESRPNRRETPRAAGALVAEPGETPVLVVMCEPRPVRGTDDPVPSGPVHTRAGLPAGRVPAGRKCAGRHARITVPAGRLGHARSGRYGGYGVAVAGLVVVGVDFTQP